MTERFSTKKITSNSVHELFPGNRDSTKDAQRVRDTFTNNLFKVNQHVCFASLPLSLDVCVCV